VRGGRSRRTWSEGSAWFVGIKGGEVRTRKTTVGLLDYIPSLGKNRTVKAVSNVHMGNGKKTNEIRTTVGKKKAQ